MDKDREECIKVLDEVLGAYAYSPTITWALRFFLRNPYESLIITDKDGKVVFMDRGSERHFGLRPGGAAGRKMTEFVPDSNIPKTLDTGYPQIGSVLELGRAKKISSVYPLIRDGEVVGAVGRVIFRSLEELNRISRKLKRLEREIQDLREKQKHKQAAHYTFDDILGKSRPLLDTINMAKKIALIETDVLITGESGTGKELFAQAIHNYFKPESPFVRVNSPAIPFELAESELFGYVKGAFSGASTSGKQGKFEVAHGGTLYLDEVASLPLTIQAKLLRVLQEREIEKLGSTRIRKLKFRMIASSNVNLKKAVAKGTFREDLYFRLAKATIEIPPLRERREDIPVYIDYFLQAINKQFGTRFKRVSGEATDCLLNYSWPGNVRELINVLEQSVLKKWVGEEIPANCLPKEVTGSSFKKANPAHREYKKEIARKETELILEALRQTKGNKRLAASLLGISRSTIYNKLQEIKASGLDRLLPKA
ncbi:MAG: sigma 54-interacting transcriptional regulator [Deltaproteobacteria bacterium]|nr:sigma 54-interacting transcriptional regulator [Deltaproteobacteria bacterium]